MKPVSYLVWTESAKSPLEGHCKHKSKLKELKPTGTMNVSQILQGLSFKVCFCRVNRFFPSGPSILVLGLNLQLYINSTLLHRGVMLLVQTIIT